MSVHVAVIGAGPGGYMAAIRAAGLGAKVTLVEEAHLGGVCLNWGCIPTKAMLTSAEVLERCREAAQFGVQIEGRVVPDMAGMVKRKDRIVQTQIKGIAGLLKQHGVSHVQGRARFEPGGRLVVSRGEAATEELQADRVVLAAGSSPLSVPAFPFDGRRILSSDHILSIPEIPESMIIVGGGVVGCEFATMFSRLGSKVTIVEALDRLLPLPAVDADCSKVLQREMKKRKVACLLNRTVLSCEHTERGVQAVVGPAGQRSEEAKGQKPDSLEAQTMLVSIGRTPNTRDMGLEFTDVELDDRGWVVTDESMQTRDRKIFAIGDVCGPSRIMLAHVATAEALVAAENALGRSQTMSYTTVPGCIFTSPEVANVGLTEAQARDKGFDCRAETVQFRVMGKAQAMGEIAGQAKMIAETTSGRLLGVHLVGPHVTELIGEAALALQTGCSVQDLAQTVHAHPTLSEIMVEVAAKASGRPMHG